MTARIALDHYVYEDIYPAFKATTDEKKITAKINRTFLNYLAQRGLLLTGDNPAVVADIGCGPCDTLIKYLTGVTFAPGFIVRATDFIPEYADVQRGEALQQLAAAQTSGVIKVVEYSVRAGDAFGGKLLELLSGPDDGTRMRNAFGIVFASHMMYHAEGSSSAARLIGDVANNLLNPQGVCILYHIANLPGTFQEFRARFGSQGDAHGESNTGAVTTDDPPAQIAAECSAAGLPLFEGEFITRLRFGTLRDDEWQAFKDPQIYDAIAESNPAAYEDLKRLYFVIQRAPLEFAADHSATGLTTFIDQIRAVIESNGAMLPSSERMQVFTRADAEATLRDAIPGALAASTAE
jgi:hypothetical protein